MKVFFASDAHLGAPIISDHKAHEKLFVDWLDGLRGKADKLFLLGDTFDYWFEYATVIPRGHTRTLGKLCQLADEGIEVHLFPGNHDTWLFSYFQNECGVTVHKGNDEVVLCGKRFYVGHGDGLCKRDRGYRFLKWVFNCRPIQVVYSWLHPDAAGWIARTWSRLSRESHQKKRDKKSKYFNYRGPENEEQIVFANAEQKAGRKRDFYVFGHRHVLFDHTLDDGARVINTGDWLWHYSFASFDGQNIKIERLPKPPTKLTKL